jgi:hypothetical protein
MANDLPLIRDPKGQVGKPNLVKNFSAMQSASIRTHLELQQLGKSATEKTLIALESEAGLDTGTVQGIVVDLVELVRTHSDSIADLRVAQAAINDVLAMVRAHATMPKDQRKRVEDLVAKLLADVVQMTSMKTRIQTAMKYVVKGTLTSVGAARANVADTLSKNPSLLFKLAGKLIAPSEKEDTIKQDVLKTKDTIFKRLAGGGGVARSLGTPEGTEGRPVRVGGGTPGSGLEELVAVDKAILAQITELTATMKADAEAGIRGKKAGERAANEGKALTPTGKVAKEPAKEGGSGLFGLIGGLLGMFGAGLTGLWEKMSGKLTGLLVGVGETALKGILKASGFIFEAVTKSIGAILRTLEAGLKGVFDLVARNVPGGLSKVKSLWNSVVSGLGAIVESADAVAAGVAGVGAVAGAAVFGGAAAAIQHDVNEKLKLKPEDFKKGTLQADIAAALSPKKAAPKPSELPYAMGEDINVKSTAPVVPLISPGLVEHLSSTEASAVAPSPVSPVRAQASAMSPKGKATLKANEAFTPTAKGDLKTGLAIGYGMHTWKNKPVTADYPGVVTRDEADEELDRQLKQDVYPTMKAAGPLSQDMFDSLADFHWNVRGKGWENMSAHVVAGTATPAYFQKFATSKGVAVPALQRCWAQDAMVLNDRSAGPVESRTAANVGRGGNVTVVAPSVVAGGAGGGGGMTFIPQPMTVDNPDQTVRAIRGLNGT